MCREKADSGAPWDSAACIPVEDHFPDVKVKIPGCIPAWSIAFYLLTLSRQFGHLLIPALTGCIELLPALEA